MLTDEEIEEIWDELETNKTCSYVTETVKFARLIEARARAEEREACAEIADGQTLEGQVQRHPARIEASAVINSTTARRIAALIRARGESQ